MPLLAEYLPWLCAEAIGFDDRDRIQQTAVAWLQVYTAITMLDDVIDSRTQQQRSSHIIAATLLIQHGLGRAYAIGGTSDEYLRAMDKAFAKTAAAHIKQPRSFEGLGDKAAALIGPAETFVALTELNETDAEWMRRVAACVATAWQGLDDITDFEEDYRAGHVSPLLRDVLDGERFSSKEVTREVLLWELVRSGMLCEALDCVREAFQSAYSLLGQRSTSNCSTLREFVGQLSDHITQVCGIVNQHQIRFGAVSNWQDASIRKSILTIDRSLAVVAQGS